MKSRFIYIIGAIMLVLMVNPFIRPLGLIGHLISTLLLAMIPLASAYALTEDRKKAIIVLLIAAPFVMLDGLNIYFTSRPMMIVAISFGTILYFYIVFLFVKNIRPNKIFKYGGYPCRIGPGLSAVNDIGQQPSKRFDIQIMSLSVLV